MDNASHLTVDKTNQYSKNWLLRNEPRLFILSLLGQILGLALISYGLSFLKVNDVSYLLQFVILFFSANLVGLASVLRPGLAQTRTRLVLVIPSFLGLTMSTLLQLIKPGGFSEIGLIGSGFVGGAFIRGYFEKRLNAQPNKKWLWNLHLVLSSLLMMAYIWGVYKYMPPLE